MTTQTVGKPKSFLDSMKGKATTAKPKKDDKPVLQLPENMHDQVQKFIKHAAAVKSETALMDAAKGQLAMPAMEFLLAECTKRKESLSSISLVAGGAKLTFLRNCRYSDIPMVERNDEATGEVYSGFDPEFEQVFEPAEIERYFKDTYEIKMKPESMTAEVMEQIKAALGEDFFWQHFEAKKSVKVAETFHDRWLTDPEFRERVRPLMESYKIKPYAPSIML